MMFITYVTFNARFRVVGAVAMMLQLRSNRRGPFGLGTRGAAVGEEVMMGRKKNDTSIHSGNLDSNC